VTLSGWSSTFVDTIHCQNLTFDTSQIYAGVLNTKYPQTAAPRMSQTGDQLFVDAGDATVSLRVVNVLGVEVANIDGRSTLELNLAPFSAGIYFATAESGHQRTVRRMVVVH